MWDTAGQERYESLIPTYLRNADYGIIVFDLTRQKSFESIEKWIKLFREYEDSPIMIVGNKTDLDVARKVDKKDALALSSKLGAEYI